MAQSASSAGPARHVWRRVGRLSSGLLSLAITLLGLLAFTFMLSHLSPIDPVQQIAGDHASEATYAQVRHDLGLDQPVLMQFWHYIEHLLRGDLGVSRLTNQPVSSDLLQTFPATIELATCAMIFAVIFGVSLALIAAWKPGSWIDNVARFISLLGYSVPVFWLGLLGLLLFYAVLHWSAGPGRLDDIWAYTLEPKTGFVLIDSWLSGDREIFWNAVAHLWLPVVILGLLAMAGITRLLRAALLEESSKEYVVLARAKGTGRGRILLRHIFPNVLGTLITVIALSYATLLEGSVLTETVFAWPGVGRYMTNALFSGDVPAILGATLLIGGCFILINALADALTWLTDPRTR
ncbi:ABC transporter permease [Pantoea ananatis]|uniref:ABC transporter permease n=1 Tax=Pantoea ananas TaxID=553 RepID=UPI0021E97D41|nr:ABC transporter permease [Pantoea ananatis]MCW0306063.1 Dipeptide transport system permease protein DppB [Pantoea ananatis]MCW0337768.1 Dipeptide transport system permease protein DppB [Pantoea ananatis]MCW0356437.1 Dipeptide transport system permease protein DppB [Pantoea ananatis]MCW0360421.1 Dipeptide transport system permease protein DppB [Pantoea ananatis]MCW1773500.1 ABC transporter permease [Pantoea ananatis]